MNYKLPKTNELSKILNFIGYCFYKGINGCYYSFYVVNNKIFMINENEDRLLIFKIDNNGKITDIEEHINNWFDFSNITEAIIIDGWEQYLFI